ncbi:MAG: Nif3-like dinuclear metal center hexameric protein [Clostridia bacterium]|nr:Nif3-like dinuclear metal center hexameric protein [Clostridia bacterium]
MKLNDIIALIEREFPLSDAYEWDNCGLLLGDREWEIKTVLLSLDVNNAVLAEAKAKNSDLILSHHPILFDGTKRIDAKTPEGKLILGLSENRIAVYSAHTNCDVGKNGINSKLAGLFGLCDVENLEENGLGRIGNLKAPMSFADFAILTKKTLKTPFVRVCGDKTAYVSRVAVASGASSDSIPTAIEKGADVIVTGDMKYHDMINYSEMGIFIVDAGHYPTEIAVIDIFENILKDCGLNLIKSKNPDIFEFI